MNPVAAVISKNVSVKILFQRKRKNGNGYPEVIMKEFLEENTGLK